MRILNKAGLLRAEILERYQRDLALPVDTVEALKDGTYGFELIGPAYTIDPTGFLDRLDGMDYYEDEYGDGDDDGTVEEESHDDMTYLMSDLNSNGLVLMRGDDDVGFCMLYPVAEELKDGLPAVYQRGRERISWSEIASYLSEATDTMLTESNLRHLYDIAIKPERRETGLGRTIRRATSDLFLNRGLSVGFIDSSEGEENHLDSVLVATRAGGVIGKELPQSYDGPHPSFLAISGGQGINKLTRNFTGRELKWRGSSDRDLSQLPDALREVVGTDEAPTHRFVGYNLEGRRWEEVELAKKAS
ncbi:hypothetical protein ACFLQN_04400 [Candidatus Aenigmatarchaeota archaeon]